MRLIDLFRRTVGAEDVVLEPGMRPASLADDVEFKIARLDLRPGDILVVRVEQAVSDVTATRIREYVLKSAAGHPVMVLSGGIDLAVLTAAEIAERTALPASSDGVA